MNLIWRWKRYQLIIPTLVCGAGNEQPQTRIAYCEWWNVRVQAWNARKWSNVRMCMSAFEETHKKCVFNQRNLWMDDDINRRIHSHRNEITSNPVANVNIEHMLQNVGAYTKPIYYISYEPEKNRHLVEWRTLVLLSVCFCLLLSLWPCNDDDDVDTVRAMCYLRNVNVLNEACLVGCRLCSGRQFLHLITVDPKLFVWFLLVVIAITLQTARVPPCVNYYFYLSWKENWELAWAHTATEDRSIWMECDNFRPHSTMKPQFESCEKKITQMWNAKGTSVSVELVQDVAQPLLCRVGATEHKVIEFTHFAVDAVTDTIIEFEPF